MILIPEIQTVVILVPRTGSGSLRRAVAAKYPQSILLYRHMEADGVPAGHDKRVTDLLEANNRYQQEARDARALLREAQQEVRQLRERT